MPVLMVYSLSIRLLLLRLMRVRVKYAKLFYLRELRGKAAGIKERDTKKEEVTLFHSLHKLRNPKTQLRVCSHFTSTFNINLENEYHYRPTGCRQRYTGRITSLRNYIPHLLTGNIFRAAIKTKLL